jgi:hypothetical protein
MIAAFLAPYPDAKKGIGMALFFFGAMVAAAYAYTPYIKIGSRTFALTVQDSRPDAHDETGDSPSGPKVLSQRDSAADAYSGLLTATKMSWMVAGVMVIAAGNLYIFVDSRGSNWLSGAIGAAFTAFFAAILGIGDASWGYHIARSQTLQFVVASIVTAGTFAVIYVGSYWIAKRKPIRRRRSVEYRAHTRGQERTDQ